MNGSMHLRAPPKKGPEVGPFGREAIRLSQAGIAVIPCDDKVPLIRYAKMTQPIGLDGLKKLIQKHPSANVGMLTGLSKITVVDIDDPADAQAMIARCGDTPLKVHTPSGGLHLWYRENGEKSSNLRSEGLEVDIKGIGGFVVMPPSVRATGQHTGRLYRFIEGSLADLHRLPTAKSGSLPRHESNRRESNCRVKEGSRNNALFRHLCTQAPHCDDFDNLLDVARSFSNEVCDPSLPDAEVVQTAKSAWHMYIEGRLWGNGAEQRAYFTKSEVSQLTAQPYGVDAFVLLAKLRLTHWQHEDFAASPKAMANAQVISRWGPQRYRNALGALTEYGALVVVHEGGRGTQDPRRFRFSSSPLLKGFGSGPNTI